MLGNNELFQKACAHGRGTATEAVLYALVGLFNTALTLGIMTTMGWLGFHYSIYTAAGYVVGFVSSYILNNRITFRRRTYSFTRFTLFVLIGAGLLAAVQLIQFVLIERLLVPELAGVAAGMVVFTGAGFFLSRRFVFSERSER